MSRDLWRAVTVISRNLVLTWVVLLSMLAIPLLFAQAVFAWLYSSRIGQPFFSTGAHTLRELTPRMVAVADIPLAFIAWFALLSVLWLMLQRGAMKLQVFVALAGLIAGRVALRRSPSVHGHGTCRLRIGGHRGGLRRADLVHAWDRARPQGQSGLAPAERDAGCRPSLPPPSRRSRRLDMNS
jgi:hypothetical protein